MVTEVFFPLQICISKFPFNKNISVTQRRNTGVSDTIISLINASTYSTSQRFGHTISFPRIKCVQTFDWYCTLALRLLLSIRFIKWHKMLQYPQTSLTVAITKLSVKDVNSVQGHCKHFIPATRNKTIHCSLIQNPKVAINGKIGDWMLSTAMDFRM